MELGTSEVRGMTEAELLEVIAGGESFTVEFKGEGRQPLSDRDLVEAVVCLANGEGGLLLVGVEDDGTVTGANPPAFPTTFTRCRPGWQMEASRTTRR